MSVIKRGDRGWRVETIQTHLNHHGADLVVDGIFGGGTETAVKDFQQRNGLVVDGLVGSKTIALLANRESIKPFLSEADLEWAAGELDLPVVVLKTINQVESRGRGFLVDQRPVILFERHIMRRRLQARGIDPEPWVIYNPDVVNPKAGGYQGGVKEWDRLNEAARISKEAAFESASWGCYQIMGFHWHSLGYTSVEAFVEQMHLSERAQLDALVRFIKADPTLHRAMHDLDWHVWSTCYNGPNYAINAYDVKLQNAYQSLGGVVS